MCRPAFFGVLYMINPWMDTANQPNREIAFKQWQTLQHTIIRSGGWVEEIDPVDGLPDMVFTANAGMIWQNKFHLSKFKCPERQGEEQYWRNWFSGKYEIVESQCNFEGAGDALNENGTLFQGYGFRSEKGNSPDTIYLELINPYFYHLDTCFCPLGNGRALYYPGAFSDAANRDILENIEGVVVPEDEAKKFACNAVVIGQSVILPAGCPVTGENLEWMGFEVHEVDVSQFMLAGGGCKCLTLKI